MKFHVRLKSLRQIIGLTQGELGDLLGVKATTVANYESSRNEPSYQMLIQLAKLFNVSSDYLLGISDDWNMSMNQNIDPYDAYELSQLLALVPSSTIPELKEYIKYLIYRQEQLSR